jgi:hypothetical protein
MFDFNASRGTTIESEGKFEKGSTEVVGIDSTVVFLQLNEQNTIRNIKNRRNIVMELLSDNAG